MTILFIHVDEYPPSLIVFDCVECNSSQITELNLRGLWIIGQTYRAGLSFEAMLMRELTGFQK